MKAIILAAGEGLRLRPYTKNRPKCMVSFRERPIIDYIIDSMKKCGITDIAIVAGYKQSILERHFKNTDFRFYKNSDYDASNMVHSLFIAEREMDEDLIISYSDIIYEDKVLKKLIQTDGDIAVVVDKDWKKLWDMRMDNPLADVETMKINNDNFIIELGKKPINYNDIEGQYIGLIKLSKNVLKKVQDFYHSLNTNIIYDGDEFKQIYMTSFLQLIIDDLMPIKAVFINGGWIEIDTVRDLEVYEHNCPLNF